MVALEQSVSAPLTSRILSDLGADVIKVEPPAGDFSRHWDGHVHGQSSYFTWLSRRKRSIALSLRQAEDREIFERLLTQADVLLFNMAAAAAERAGLTPQELGARYPRLVVCQITGYGRSGRSRDRKAYDMMVQAESGALALTGDEAGPVRIGVSLADVGTGLYALGLVLAALYERTRTGRGRFIDASMFEVMAEFASPNLTAYANSGFKHGRYRSRHHAIVPYGVFPCQDGFIAIAVEQDSEWVRFCETVLRRPDLLARADIARNEQRLARRAEVEGLVEAEFRRRPASEWEARLLEAQIAFGKINDVDKVWDHPVEHDLQLHGEVSFRDGSTARVQRSLAERAFGRAAEGRLPDVDEHRAEILAELGRLEG